MPEEKLIVMIDEASRSSDEWFKKQELGTIVGLPFDQACPSKLAAGNYRKAFKFFRAYQQFMEKENLSRDYPTPFYKAKRACCDLAIKLGRGKPQNREQSTQAFHIDDWDFAVLDWIRACYQAVIDEKLAFLFLANNFSAENELKRILFENRKVRPEFQQNTGGFELYLRKLIDWFLRCYDLPTAAKLMWVLRKVRKRPINVEKSQLGNARFSRGAFSSFLPPLLALALVALLWIFGSPDFELLTDVLIPAVDAVQKLERGWPPQIFATLLAAFVYPGLIVAALIVFILLMRGYTGALLFLKLLMPRLTASIVVGYLPLVMSADAWSVLDALQPLHAFLLVSAMLIFSALFLFLEVYNKVGTASVAFGRSLTVFSVGFLQSFAIGLIVSDLITTAFAARANLDVQTLPHALFGQISPQVLVLMFPFALFIGFFVQVIWQDKTVTQPL